MAGKTVKEKNQMEAQEKNQEKTQMEMRHNHQETAQAEMLHYHMAEWGGGNAVWASRDFLRKGYKSPASLWIREGRKEPSEILVDSYEPERLHTHADFLELFYVYNGRGVAFLEGTNYILKKGDIFVIRPGQVHANFPLEDLMIYNCIISCAFLEGKSGLSMDGLMPFLHLTGKTLSVADSPFLLKTKAFGRERRRSAGVEGGADEKTETAYIADLFGAHAADFSGAECLSHRQDRSIELFSYKGDNGSGVEMEIHRTVELQ